MNYGIDIAKKIEDLLIKELTNVINLEIINNLLSKKNIRRTKIEIIKEKIKSSE